MLHWVMVAFLMFFALIAMRLLSWAPMWFVAKVTKSVKWKSVLLLNAIALSLFFAFLWWQTLPGETFDVAAAVFGVAVYLGFFIGDLFWLPWTRNGIK